MQNNNKNSHKSVVSVNKMTLSACDEVQYLYCKGEGTIDNVVVLVHGISRNAQSIIESFTSYMSKNTVLIAPIFTKEYATDYQRLGRKNKGPRADYIVQAIINEMTDKYNLGNIKVNLFGFSAGAQFVHRYAFVHPTRVNKVAIVAAGWYTMPTDKYKYPHGLLLNDEFTDVEFEMARLLRVNYRVYVGEKDYLRDRSLNKSKKVDKLQGQNRLERAENWSKVMNQCFQDQKINNHVKLEILDGVTHDFNLANALSSLCEKVSIWFKQVA